MNDLEGKEFISTLREDFRLRAAMQMQINSLTKQCERLIAERNAEIDQAHRDHELINKLQEALRERPPTVVLVAHHGMKFKLGDMVRKTKGSQWHGKVVGTYATELTPEGYAVESSTEKGSVQIYPVNALEHWNPLPVGRVELHKAAHEGMERLMKERSDVSGSD